MDALSKAKKFYKDEFESKQLYSYLAKVETNPEIKETFNELTKIEAKHAKFWYMFLNERGINVSAILHNHRLWIYKILRMLLGNRLFITILEMKESNSTDEYYNYYNDPILTEKERNYLSQIIEDELEHEKNFGKQKGNSDFGNIRDFILGMNDGLVEILGTVTGLTAVYPKSSLAVGTSGLVVGIAGALSMAIGAYTSVRSQRQVNEGIKNKMELLFNVSKDRAKEELLSKLNDSGIPNDISKEVVEKLGDNKDAMTNLLVEDVKENEIKSALYTGIAYLVGLVFPVIPYFFVASSSLVALVFSVIFAAIALSIVGTVVSIASESLSIKSKIIEMVVTGLGAAALSYLFGKLVQLIFGIQA
ncbi:VIT1/CCC1 transporter family protein [Thermoanaerobacterium sp. RBIITD]|uniref:VIT1/CCC1 transporter family protein n=1 Tax=Thermoanaerobacterium sp. RBIITD TaxID=1550240 RepID=UPI000BB97D91|nr:VIT1/CCC1 transporter family protein [Thermoanaerobacterium sp. RBIITD]SNX53208.1 Predicted Fe2+/Mn2+ transporter, VIT1/CCC1 family [Thermoanaerobacterium sp. RBIITD]